MPDPAPRHGGPRPGAGRPRQGTHRRVYVKYVLPPELIERVRESAAAEGVSASALAERWLRAGEAQERIV